MTCTHEMIPLAIKTADALLLRWNPRVAIVATIVLLRQIYEVEGAAVDY